MASPEDIRSITLRLPGALERPSYGGRPSWRTKTRMFAWLPDPEALVVWVESEEEKLALLASEPEKFYSTPHHDGHPLVLVRLPAVDRHEAQELVTESWRLRAPRSLVKEWDASQP